MKKTKAKKQRRASKKPIGKDAPFPIRKAPSKKKVLPRSAWTRIAVPTSLAKDGPFPRLTTALGWERVEFSALYQGTRGPRQPIALVIRAIAQLTSAWPETASAGIDLSAVNFAQEELILVGLGERPNNGYLVQIDEILHFTDRGDNREDLTSVSYSEHRASGPLDVLTYPAHLVRLRKLTGTESEFVPS